MKIRQHAGRKAVVAALTAAVLSLASTAVVLPGANAAPAPALAPAVLAVAAPSGNVPLTPAGAPQTIPGLSTWTVGAGQFTLGAGAKVIGADATLTAELAAQLSTILGRTVGTGTTGAIAGDIEVALDASRAQALGEEGYELIVGDTIKVTGAKAAGAFYGTQTIAQILTQGNVVNKGSSLDVPKYEERGVGLCACQLQISMESLERTMKDMAYNKLNQLWLETKLKSDAYPKANFWSYYTKAEATQIAAWAKKYHIELILEVNSPGHMRPWLYNYPELQLVNNSGQKKENQLDITKPEAFTMLTKLIDEYSAAFPDLPYWHMGGDEYMISDTYDNYSQFATFVAAHPDKFPAGSGPGDVFIWFMNEINEYVKSKGKEMRVWNDGIPASGTIKLDTDVRVEYWNRGRSLTPQQVLDAGHDVQNSTQAMYFNRPGAYGQNLAGMWNNNWTPQTMDGGVVVTDVPGKGRVTGAKLTAWPDDTPMATEAQVEEQIFATTRFLAQATWGGAKPTADYAKFSTLSNTVGRAPGYNTTDRTPVGNGGYTISTAGKSVNPNGSAVTVSSAAGATWKLEATDDNYYKISAGADKCLAIAGGVLWLQAPMDQDLAPSLSDCATTDRRVQNLQKWEIIKVDGGHTIRNAITQLPLGVNAAGALTQEARDVRAPGVFVLAGELSTAVQGPARAVANAPATVTVSVENRTASTVTAAVVTPTVPAGWTVTPASVAVGEVAAGATKDATFTVTPSATTSYGTNFTVSATTTYKAGENNLTSSSSASGLLSCSAAPVRPIGAVADSANNAGGEITPATNAVDGNPGTFWGTAWTPSNAPLPHTLTVDLGKEMSVCGINALPRQGSTDGAANGRIKNYEVYVSSTPTAGGTKVAEGAFPNAATLQSVFFAAPATGRYVTLKAMSEQRGQPWTTLAELTVEAGDAAVVVPTATATAPATTAPATTAPATTAPATTAPATTAPATTAPATTAPATTAPATTAPVTTAPATTAPATTAPATTAPATTAPATTAPATTAPATTAPATTAPATTAPVTTAPPTTAPATTDPATTAPATTEPATTAPATTAPGTGTPSASVGASDVQQGQTVTFTGSGFQPGENVRGTVNSEPVDLGVVVADANGNVSFTWVVPADFAAGEHTVTLAGETSLRTVQATFTIFAAAAVDGSGNGNGLANTGSATTALWGGALLMALLGAGMVMANRRNAGLHK